MTIGGREILEGHENMAPGFIDVEKAYDSFAINYVNVELDGCRRGRG